MHGLPCGLLGQCLREEFACACTGAVLGYLHAEVAEPVDLLPRSAVARDVAAWALLRGGSPSPLGADLLRPTVPCDFLQKTHRDKFLLDVFPGCIEQLKIFVQFGLRCFVHVRGYLHLPALWGRSPTQRSSLPKLIQSPLDIAEMTLCQGSALLNKLSEVAGTHFVAGHLVTKDPRDRVASFAIQRVRS